MDKEVLEYKVGEHEKKISEHDKRLDEQDTKINSIDKSMVTLADSIDNLSSHFATLTKLLGWFIGILVSSLVTFLFSMLLKSF